MKIKNFSDNNGFVKGMREFKQCVEREKIVFNVEVKDPNAPVEFFKNGEKIEPDGERVEIKDLGNGKHQVRGKKQLDERTKLRILLKSI